MDWLRSVDSLPITKHLAPICQGIAQHQITLLEAPPGTGKSTVLPLALLDEPSLKGKSILILQPRRIAAKSVAARMASLLGEAVGRTVGYSVRLETKRSRDTRIEVITEGLLTRRLIADPELSGVGAIIFDEFHERSIHADLSLALTLETISVLRPDLKIVIMSATLGESLPSDYLANAWRYTFEGRTFPVTLHYEPGESRQAVWERLAAATKRALANHDGDILTFAPGAYEIQRTEELLTSSRVDAIILPLYGDLPPDKQLAAILPDPHGRRKIVLATTIAETSLTIEGVRVVIDSGTHKVARVDSGGFSSLSTEPISRDAADQRAGRAGRTAPGVCVRLWSEQEHFTRRPFREPEVLRTDMTSPLLDLAAWGVRDPATFPWITKPPLPSLVSARETLVLLGATTGDGGITEHGRAVATLGAHPRLGNLARVARAQNLEPLAARIITILEERDVLGPHAATVNIHARLDALSGGSRRTPSTHRLLELSERWGSRINSLPPPSQRKPFAGTEEDAVAVLLAAAYPDRIARRREHGSHKYLLSSGKGAHLPVHDPLRQAEYIVACSVQEVGGELSIRSAAPLSTELFKGELAHLLSAARDVRVDPETGAFSVTQQTRIGAIAVTSRVEPRSSDDDLAQAFATWLSSSDGWAKVRFGDASLALLARLRWARERQGGEPTLPDLSDATLQATVAEWLLPHLSQAPSLREVTEHLVHQALEALIPWGAKRELDEIAPATLTIPTGRARPLDYSCGVSPRFEARIQELFGMLVTPTIGRFRVPATISLLSPAHRPVQVTQDLANFWRVGYPEVRKELRGRYPKHRWPENPLDQES